MLKHIFYFTISLFFASCLQQKPNADNTILDLSHPSDEEVHCADLIEVCQWISLDTSSNYLLKSVEKVDFYDNKYYVLNCFDKAKILIFDTSGNYLASIGNKGGGPGEYAEINDFAIDKSSGKIYILTQPSEVFVYEKDGIFVESKKLDESLLWKLISTDNGILLSSLHKTFTEGDNAYLFYEFDNDLNFKQKQVSVLPKQMMSVNFLQIPFQKSENKIYYCDEFTNQIYTYSDGRFAKEYDIHFANSLDYNLRADFMTANENLAKSDFIMNYAVSDSKLLLFSCQKGPMDVCLINKSDGKVLFNKSFNEIFPSLICPIGNGEFLTPICIEEYQNAWKSLNIKQPSFQVTDNDNYLILRWKLKND